jgi:predicted O-linked N-acetylglucosamine transferase (SPINDLY family)
MASADRAVTDELRNAYALHQAGRLNDAALAYGEILKTSPQEFDALFLLGLLHLQSSRLQEAENLLGRAARLNPASADALAAHATALQQMGRNAEALATLDKVLALKPDHAITWNNRGNLLLTLGRGSEAIASYDRALTLKPDYAEAWHNRAVTRLMAQDYRGAEADLHRALAAKPDYPDALEHIGMALAGQDRHEQALASYDAALTLNATNPDLFLRRADSLLQLNRCAEALADYDRSVSLNLQNGDAWHNRGIALSRLKRLSEAIESYDRAIRLTPNSALAWHNRGSALLDLKDRPGALASYERALAIKPDYAEAWKSRGVVLNLLQHDAEALDSFDRAIALKRDDADAWLGRANALARLERDEEAVSAFDEALRLRPNDARALYNRASVLSLLKRFEQSARDCESLLSLDPDYPYARGLLMHARLHCCDWSALAAARDRISEDLRAGKRVIHPFGHLAFSTSPDEQLRSARILAGDSFPAAPAPLWRGERYTHRKLRVAYLSGDFYEHATAFLMAGVFEQHDRARFEIYAVSYSPDDGSEMRARLESAFHRFLDVSGESDTAVAALLREMEIDIAVDLKGYTGRARPGILAFRPAPVQVHYLGYPGTMGTPYIDYLLADRVVISDEDKPFYDEETVYLPDSYQCNDSGRRVDEHTPSRKELGLPERGFVFCCFNSNYKIMPEIFEIWMRLLHSVPESVLWLFEENAVAASNLRREAQARGIAPERLVFAKRVPLSAHLARLKQADLVLDTLPYGAHTTASDALWVGVPVLTCLGTTFAGRVAASLLEAVELPELITHSLDEYETRARMLAEDTPSLLRIKAALAEKRDTCPLFDTARITRHLEAAYTDMHARQQRGERPAGFAVQPISGPSSS